VIDSFLQELRPWNLEEFKKKFSFPDFFFFIFVAIGLKLGLLFCSKEIRVLV
jgi:uncharacterized membrane protein